MTETVKTEKLLLQKDGPIELLAATRNTATANSAGRACRRT